MLILKAFINHKEIEEVRIQNVQYVGGGLYEYAIKQPKFDYPTITHDRSKGWKALAIKALMLLEER